MEPWLSIAVFVVAAGVTAAWWVANARRGAGPEGGDERSAIDFVGEVQAELTLRGVSAEPESGAFAIRIADGRSLPLTQGFFVYARQRRDDAAAVLVAAWARDGLLEDRGRFVARVAERLAREGHPALAELQGTAVRVEDAVLVLEEAFSSTAPVATTIDAVAADVAWWRAGPRPRDEIDDALEVQLLPAAQVAREDLSARLRALSADVPWAGPQPCAEVGAGWVARVTWCRRGLVKPVARWAAGWDTSSEALLTEVVARVPTGGHPLKTWQPGVLQGALGTSADLRLMLLAEGTFRELGVGPPTVLWPLQSDRVVVAAAADPDALARLFERAFDGDTLAAPLSWVPLVRDVSGGWRWLSLPPEHELAGALDRLVGQQIRLEYGWLHPVVEDLADAGEVPIPLPVVLDDAGRPFVRWHGQAALVPAEVHHVWVDGERVLRDPWVVAYGATPRTDLGLPWLQVVALSG